MHENVRASNSTFEITENILLFYNIASLKMKNNFLNRNGIIEFYIFIESESQIK